MIHLHTIQVENYKMETFEKLGKCKKESKSLKHISKKRKISKSKSLDIESNSGNEGDDEFIEILDNEKIESMDGEEAKRLLMQMSARLSNKKKKRTYSMMSLDGDIDDSYVGMGAFGDIEPNVNNSNKRKVSLMSIDEERETNTVVKSGKVQEVEDGINDGESSTDDDDPLC